VYAARKKTKTKKNRNFTVSTRTAGEKNMLVGSSNGKKIKKY